MEKEAKGEIEGKETARGTSAKKVKAKLAFSNSHLSAFDIPNEIMTLLADKIFVLLYIKLIKY